MQREPGAAELGVGQDVAQQLSGELDRAGADEGDFQHARCPMLSDRRGETTSSRCATCSHMASRAAARYRRGSTPSSRCPRTAPVKAMFSAVPMLIFVIPAAIA